LETIENPSKLHNLAYSIPGYALSMALNSDDQPALSYLRAYRQNSASEPIIMWQVRPKTVEFSSQLPPLMSVPPPSGRPL
jgi:hypothetical protein